MLLYPGMVGMRISQAQPTLVWKVKFPPKPFWTFVVDKWLSYTVSMLSYALTARGTPSEWCTLYMHGCYVHICGLILLFSDLCCWAAGLVACKLNILSDLGYVKVHWERSVVRFIYFYITTKALAYRHIMWLHMNMTIT